MIYSHRLSLIQTFHAAAAGALNCAMKLGPLHGLNPPSSTAA